MSRLGAALLALALLPAPALAQQAGGQAGSVFDDAFKSIQGSLNQQFDAAETSIDADIRKVEETMREVYAQFDRDLAPYWGDDRRLPERKVWVAYPDGLDARVIVDYETGEIRVEVPDGPDADARIARLMAEVLKADSATLDAFDEAANRLRKELSGAEAALAQGRPTANVPKEIGSQVAPDAPVTIETHKLSAGTSKPIAIKSGRKPFKPDHLDRRAEDFRASVMAQASRFGLPPSLIASVIRNESAFNPRAQSPIPAFGLMQLVPSSGGRDAFRFVYGEDKAPGPDYLFQARPNIELGSAYLHILDTRYLASITDGKSRLYCAIAAYNTGAGNLARAFGVGKKIGLAAERINAMAPDAVYSHLREHLPYEETRNYLLKVVRDMDRYAAWNERS